MLEPIDGTITLRSTAEGRFSHASAAVSVEGTNLISGLHRVSLVLHFNAWMHFGIRGVAHFLKNNLDISATNQLANEGQ